MTIVAPVESLTSAASDTDETRFASTSAGILKPADIRASRALRLASGPACDVLATGAALAAVTAVHGPVRPVVATLMAMLWLVLLGAHGSYGDLDEVDTPHTLAARVLRAGSALGLLVWIATVIVHVPASAETMLLLTVALTGATLALRVVAAVALRRPPVGRRIVLAGTYDQVRLAMAELRRSPGPTEVVAACLLHGDGQELFDVPVSADFTSLARQAADHEADTVVVLPSEHLTFGDLRRLGWELEASRRVLCLGTGLLDVRAARARIGTLAGLQVLKVCPAPRLGVGRLVKELWERLAAATLLLALSPLLALIAAAVRLDSSGPALFRQTRVGRDGTLFTMLKFRSMTTDAESLAAGLLGENDSDGVLFKLRRDPRVTRVGQVLRRYSLDELPQLGNVALGQMSLVGPRPALPSEVEAYDHDPRRRLVVKPGLTGLWQVSGRSDLSWEESVRLDLHYVDNWSLRLDLSVVARTASAVLRHRGAY